MAQKNITIYNKYPDQVVQYTIDGGESYTIINSGEHGSTPNTGNVSIQLMVGPAGEQEKECILCINKDGTDNGVTLTVGHCMTYYWDLYDITNNSNLSVTIRKP